jgi:hypothetical protein
MKTDLSIKNISIAKIKRSTMNLDKWSKTIICSDIFPPKIDSLPEELPIVFFNMDNVNWTLITTKRIIGQIDSRTRQVLFSELDDTIWGDFKSKNKDNTIFRTVNFEGEQNDFLMETGEPAMGIISAVRTIEQISKEM